MTKKISLAEAVGLLTLMGINADRPKLYRLTKMDVLESAITTTPTGRIFFERDEMPAVKEAYLLYHPSAEAA